MCILYISYKFWQCWALQYCKICIFVCIAFVLVFMCKHMCDIIKILVLFTKPFLWFVESLIFQKKRFAHLQSLLMGQHLTSRPTGFLLWTSSCTIAGVPMENPWVWWFFQIVNRFYRFGKWWKCGDLCVCVCVCVFGGKLKPFDFRRLMYYTNCNFDVFFYYMHGIWGIIFHCGFSELPSIWSRMFQSIVWKHAVEIYSATSCTSWSSKKYQVFLPSQLVYWILSIIWFANMFTYLVRKQTASKNIWLNFTWQSSL